MSIRARLCVLGLLLLGSVAAPRPADAQTTGVFLDSLAGDSIGAGHPWSYTPANANFSAEVSFLNGTSIALETKVAPLVGWSFAFKAPGLSITRPGVGIYESARRAPFSMFVGLNVTGDGRSCDQVTGRFVVLEAEYAGDGSVTRFAADFEQHCEDADAALFGAVRYNSTVSTLLPFGGNYPRHQLVLTAPANGSIQGIGINCGSSGSQCAADVGFPLTRALTAVPDPGFVFAGWTDGCSGGPRTTVRLSMRRTCSAVFTPFATVSPRTLAVITGTADSSIGSEPIVVSPANSLWGLRAEQNGFLVDLFFVGKTQARFAALTFKPPTGATIEIGHEYQTAAVADATHGVLFTGTDGSGCLANGSFTVRDWAAGNDGVPTRFAVDFKQACGGGVYGTLLYESPYQYGRIDVPATALHFSAVHDQVGIVSHSADQAFSVSPSGPLTIQWDARGDASWLTATPLSGSGASTVTARVVSGAFVAVTSPATAHVQLFARGILNVPDPVTVTLDLVPPDTTVRPFAVFRPAGGGWFLPTQSPIQFGLPGDVPLSGDFNGDATPDIAVFRPWTGEWFVQGQAVRQWGSPGDIPVPADYNGDGITDLAVFRQSGPFVEWFIAGESGPRAWGLRGDIPVPGDYDGDGLADVAVFRPATGTWWIRWSSVGVTVSASLGLAGDIPVVADFDADRKADVAVFRPSTGVWYITLSAGGSDARQFGEPGDIPVPLDVTGDGRAELRFWRPSTGTWYALNRISSSPIPSQQYGLPGDMPITARPELERARPADFDGDLRADVTIYRPSTGEWFTRQSATGYGSFTIQQLGADGDIPVPGDYDGDRRANAAVYRPSTGEWRVRRFDGTVLQRAWGLPDDRPVPADYDGDGRIDLAVYRPSTGEWLILTAASDYAAALVVSWGLPGDVPMPADFDGDGRVDAAVYRPSTGEWYVAPSSGGWFVRQWGLPGDVPIARDFDGDGRADLAVYRPSTGEWYVLGAISGAHVFTRQWGLTGDVPVADDYDGDDVADVAVFRPATREWFVLPSSGAPPFVLQWGLAGDLPVTRR